MTPVAPTENDANAAPREKCVTVALPNGEVSGGDHGMFNVL
jgi:hypothetical protein